jgi:hypothetical protein
MTKLRAMEYITHDKNLYAINNVSHAISCPLAILPADRHDLNRTADVTLHLSMVDPSHMQDGSYLSMVTAS